MVPVLVPLLADLQKHSSLMVVAPVMLLAGFQKHSRLVVVVLVTLLADLPQMSNLVVVVVPPVGTLLPGSALSLSADSMFVDPETLGPDAPQTTFFVENSVVGLQTLGSLPATQMVVLDTDPAPDAALCHLSSQLSLHLSSLTPVLHPLFLHPNFPIVGRSP